MKSIFAIILFALTTVSIQAAEKAAQCATCHGAKGISSNGQIPALAGQQANYIEAQLKAFKEGSRTNPGMQGVAAGLSEADIESLATFFAGLPSKPASSAKADASAKDKFAMCGGCHGSAAEGRGAIPRLAGQQAQYIATQLYAFKKGTRKGPMVSVAASLTEKDIKVISSYLSTLK